jgi:hypothetical protein
MWSEKAIWRQRSERIRRPLAAVLCDGETRRRTPRSKRSSTSAGILFKGPVLAPRIRLPWPASSLLLVAILAASCSPAQTGPSSSRVTATTSRQPSSTSTQPSTTTTQPTLQSVAWTGVTVPPAVCPGLSQPVKLTATTGATGTFGSATVPVSPGHQVVTPDDLIVEYGVSYGELEPDENVAALDVWCSNTGGTADGQIQNSLVLYTWISGRLTVLSTLTPPQLSKGVHAPSFDVSTGGITISTGAITTKELFFGAQDAVCCASGRATTVWTFNGHDFSPSTTIQVQPTVEGL